MLRKRGWGRKACPTEVQCGQGRRPWAPAAVPLVGIRGWHARGWVPLPLVGPGVGGPSVTRKVEG